ncbi:MAG: 6-pyruvoyl tetrahydropterin synthase family protein [Bacteroidetes bacterium]|nr:6-pyruvoyl tetrahydropterin synthase family protein [Bacteroidota bacterium]MBS1648201.1 6-pyruvoyl tetrahydropterin synthase family protein [Bacteroidota bacterium]
MSKIRVTKVFTLDVAHALEGYDGLCKNIHGHTYHFRVTVCGKIKNEIGHPKNGMVVDFGDLKKIVRKEILEKFDHSLVLMEGSSLLQSIRSEINERLILTPFQPSCENLLLHFISILKPLLPAEIELIAARLDETPTSYSEWFLADQA